MNIYLTGFMGTGKSTVAKALAERIHWPVIDMDQEIARRENRTIPQIFSQQGEKYFRNIESDLLAELAMRSKWVISTGGGIVTRSGNQEILQKGFVISLFADKETIIRRLEHDTGRPLLAGGEFEQRIDQLLKERTGLYESANLRIDTSELDIEEILNEILAHPFFNGLL